MPLKPTVTLLTDFGGADYFVAAMKGVILSLQPAVRLVDLTHEIPPHDVAAAAFTLLACYRDFPLETIHLAVVDPGVGSARRPVAVSAGGYIFIGPDNGIFSYILDREPGARVFHLTNRKYFRPDPSTTFHGRDIFAPVAAAIAGGAMLSDVGQEIRGPVRLESIALSQGIDQGTWNAVILHIDRFGNCVTNFTRESLSNKDAASLCVEINGQTVTGSRECYADASNRPGQLFAIWGSAGFLELSLYCDSAAKRLDAKRGQRVRITLQKEASQELISGARPPARVLGVF